MSLPGYDEWKTSDPADDCCEYEQSASKYQHDASILYASAMKEEQPPMRSWLQKCAAHNAANSRVYLWYAIAARSYELTGASIMSPPPVNSFDMAEDVNRDLYRADTIARRCNILIDAGLSADEAVALARETATRLEMEDAACLA